MQQKKNQQNGQRNVMLTVSNALDQSEKQRIEVAGDVTIAQAVKDQGLAPTGSFDVFDAAGKVVSDVQARNLTDENVYVGVQRVAGGAGIPVDRIDELRTDYPSLRAVRGREVNGSVQMFVLRLPDGENRTDEGHYECVIDLSSGPMTYVLNWPPSKGRHPHVYTQATVPGTRRSCLSVCQGDVNQILAASADPIEKMGAYLNHIISVLNS